MAERIAFHFAVLPHERSPTRRQSRVPKRDVSQKADGTVDECDAEDRQAPNQLEFDCIFHRIPDGDHHAHPFEAINGNPEKVRNATGVEEQQGVHGVRLVEALVGSLVAKTLRWPAFRLTSDDKLHDVQDDRGRGKQLSKLP